MKNTCPFYTVFQVLKVLLNKNLFDTATKIFCFFVLFISFYIRRYPFFSQISELHSTLSGKKDFLLFNRFTRTAPPTPFIYNQNLLNVT